MVIENGKWTVYVHINKANGKMYVGVTSEQYPKHRWGSKGINYRGCVKFYHAIQKYGWNSFEHFIFAKNLTQQEASHTESLLIKLFDTIDNGYNQEPGGVNQGPRSDEARRKIKEARARQVITREAIEKTAAAHRGTRQSDETKAAISRGNRLARGRKVMCIETGFIYASVAEASEKTGWTVGQIGNSARRNHLNAPSRNRGPHWKYV